MKYEVKDAPGFEEYYYLDPENRSVISKRTGKALKIRRDHCGYPEVHLSVGGRDLYRKVHRLFAEAYHPNPDNLPLVNHKDADKENFHPDNLEWCTNQYNVTYGTASDKRSATHTGMKKPWVEKTLGKPVIAVDEFGNEFYYSSGKEAARQLDIRHSKVEDVLCGRRKSTHGYRFYHR